MIKLSGLNKEQRLAVRHLDGPMVVVAGAGTGKTRTIAFRAAFLLENGVEPESILAITFTNRAAREMKDRISRMIGAETAERMAISTIHSLCVRILRHDIGILGRDTQFTIFDTSDQLALVRKALVENGFDPQKNDPRSMLWRIGAVKNLFPKTNPDEFADEVFSGAYKVYNRLLAENNALDFDDMLMFTARLFQNKKALAPYQDRFRYIMVDEYQDINECQYNLIKSLAQRHKNLYVVGDDDQSIYGWRGAQVRNILNFERDFKGAGVIKLERNYRSTGVILDAANHVIKNNAVRRDKKLTTSEPKGEEVSLIEADDELVEAAAVVDIMAAEKNLNHIPYGDFAILYRTNFQSRLFEEKLIQNGISYIMIGGTRFFERREIKDITAYLRVLANPGDELSLLRVLNFPARGIGDKSLERVRLNSLGAKIPLLGALKAATGDQGIQARAREGIQSFLELYQELQALAEAEPLKPLSVARRLAARVNFRLAYEQACSDRNEALRRWENIEEFINAVAEYQQSEKRPTLSGFLDKIALMNEEEEELEPEQKEDKAVLMTLHGAKGLEFKVVFIVGAEEGFLPHERCLTDEEIEEERRLFYVGMTRARKKLFISHAMSRKRFGNILPRVRSRFVDEIPERLLRVENIEDIRESREQARKAIAKDYLSQMRSMLED